MSFEITWNEDSPNKSMPARDLDIFIREVKIALRERLEIEHEFSTGEHLTGTARVSFGALNDRPEPKETNPGSVYIALDSEPAKRLFFDVGTEWLEIGYLHTEILDTEVDLLNTKIEDHEEKNTNIHGVGESGIPSRDEVSAEVDTKLIEHAEKDNPHPGSQAVLDENQKVPIVFGTEDPTESDVPIGGIYIKHEV